MLSGTIIRFYFSIRFLRQVRNTTGISYVRRTHKSMKYLLQYRLSTPINAYSDRV